MIDVKLFLQNSTDIDANNKKRGKNIDIKGLKLLAEERTSVLKLVEDIRAKINSNAKVMKDIKDSDREKIIKEGRSLKKELKVNEGNLVDIESNLNIEIKKYPNILNKEVKEGKDDNDNELIREVGKKREFDFDIKDHITLGENLGIIDIERAAKVSGSRFAYLKGDAVLLQFALIQYALSELVKEGFSPTIPPHIISLKAMDAMGYLDHGGDQEIYHMKDDESVLIGTSEQAIGPMHMDEIVDSGDLPLRYVGISPCYRREAGSHGKDVRGILRLHQFDKVEMFSFTKPEDSEEEHEKLLAVQESLMNGLGLPYRVMRLCSGDTGGPSSMTYDIETWIPSQDMYRETHSTSNTTDYQTRRLKIRYKGKDGNELVHALNGTAFAIGRMLIAILENNQQKDGSITVPKVLEKWMGKKIIK